MKFVELAFLSPYQSASRKIIGRSILILAFNHAIGAQLYAMLEEYLTGGKDIELYIDLIFESLIGILMYALFLTGMSVEKEVQQFLEDFVVDYENSELEERQIMKTSMRQTYIISVIFGCQ
ncbi:hypothetical protein TKK_0011784 [Trichogramma kaykai]